MKKTLALSLVALMVLVQCSFAAKCIWINTAGGRWDDTNNWSTQTVPASGDMVYITNNATFAVNSPFYNDDMTFGKLVVGGASGIITLNWGSHSSYLIGQATFGTNAVLNLVDDSSGHVLQGIITNYGRINWQQGDWTFDNGSRLENTPGGLVNVQCDQLVEATGANDSFINNAGIFRKSAGSGETDATLPINNTGTVDVQAGTLALSGNITNSGTINIASGMIFALRSGMNRFSTNSLFTGSGVCEMGECSVYGKLQGPVTYRIVYDVTFKTELVSGTMVWDYTSGNQYGPLTIDSNAVYNLGSMCTVNGAITNWGTIVYPANSAYGSWTFVAPGKLENRPGGIIDLQADMDFYYDGGVVPFDNAGLLLKSGGTNESTIDSGFTLLNTGTIEVKSGTLTLNGMTSSNLIEVASGAALLLNSGDFFFGPVNTFTGSGVVDLDSFWDSGIGIIGPLYGSVEFKMDNDAYFTNCVLGGTLDWISGDMYGGLTVGTNGALVTTNSENVYGSITNFGQIAINPPGLTPGGVGAFCSLSIEGSYLQASNGTYGLAIGGHTSDLFDHLIVSGNTSLNGKLFASLANGFQPVNGNSFKFLSCASLSGAFNALEVPLGLSVAYTTNSAKLVMTTAVGALKVALQPAAVTNVGRWQVDGGAWETTGTVVSNLLVGTHVVGFESTYGWTAPADISVMINSNKSTTATAIYLPLTNQLQIRMVAGRGGVSPNYSNAWLQIGRYYSVTSTPASGFIFDGWTVSTNWAGGTTTSSRTLNFWMATNLTLLATLFETSRPSFTVTAPAAGQRWSNANFSASGTATDIWGVANVRYQLNQGAWHHAIGSNQWTGALTNLAPGTNQLSVYAVNVTGWHSAYTNTLNFDYVVTNQLQIAAAGLGKVSPNYSNAWLEIGRNYSITSSPASGFVFSNWIVSTNWIGNLLATNQTLRFMMASNLTLLPTFVETSRPVFAITSPTNRQHLSASQGPLNGTASDKWAVTNVSFSLNGVWTNATTANNWSNWTATLWLVNGTNYISAYAQNRGGKCSATNSIYVVSSFTASVTMNIATPPQKEPGFTFTLQVSKNSSGHLEYSEDLIHWTSWTNFDTADGVIQFHDTSAANSPARFYRAVIP